MKKKKKPVMLLVGLTLVVAVVAFFNITQFNFAAFKINSEMAKRQAEAQKQQAGAGQAKAQMAKQVEQGMLKLGKYGAEGIPPEPIVKKPKFERIEPVQNESVVNSMWYKEGSNTKKKGEEVRDDQGRS